MTRLTSLQIHNLMWIGDSPNGRRESPLGRDMVVLRNRNMIESKDGIWRLSHLGRLAVHGFTSCPAIGKCIAKHTFDYDAKKAPPRTPLSKALERLVFDSQGMLDGVQLHPDLFDEETVEALEGSLRSAKHFLSQEGA